MKNNTSGGEAIRSGIRSVLYGISLVGDKILSILSIALAVILLIYSGYSLWDSFYIERVSFSSWDLLQYRPKIEEGVEELSFEDLLEINEDVKAWITLYDTHIDYPLTQGKNDLEYVNKNVYGENSLSGSIYLSTSCAADFSDPYSIIYGHHMENGAMFGDITNYSEKEYFENHNTGVLATPGMVYDIHIFACILTDAYDSVIYNPSSKTKDDYPRMLEYIEANALQFDKEATENLGKLIGFDMGEEYTRLVALSTCADAGTYARYVLFGTLTPRTGPVVDPDEPETEPVTPPIVKPEIRGHGTDKGKTWALLNLICLIITAYLFLPLFCIDAKFSRHDRMKKINGYGTFIYKIGGFLLRNIIGFVIELVLVAGAIVLFILTENMNGPLVITDQYTPYMIGFMVACWTTDVIFFLYHKGKKVVKEAVAQ